MTTDDQVSIQILERYACESPDGSVVEVVEQRFQLETMTARGLRKYPGAKFWSLSDGEQVKMIDSGMFEVVGTGEILLRRFDLL